jgi:protein-S-isoprenylcysteine O-methyltransferase Ste14
MPKMPKWIDMPPVWLAGFLALAWVQAAWVPMGLSLGGVLVGGGVLLIALAAMEFRKYKTTIVPHETPGRLIRSGIFKRSRNPIYLGDALILAGLILRWDAVLSLPLIPVFVWVIERRFVIPEENRMRRSFRADFARYCEKTRRWI